MRARRIACSFFARRACIRPPRLHSSSLMQSFCHSVNLSAYPGARKARAQQNCTEINQSASALIFGQNWRGTHVPWIQISCHLVATDLRICLKPAFESIKCRFLNISVYSHSIVPGGLEVMSYRTRLTPGTSLQMRLAHRASTSGGKRNQSAVMASSLVTARSVQTSR